MKVQAAVVRATHPPMSLETFDLEDVRDNEILVRLVAGLCHTDLAMRDQAFPVPQPIVLGHEGAGVVDRIGRALTKIQLGDHGEVIFNSCSHRPGCNEHEPSYWRDFFGSNFAGQRAS
jgi:aryl-alcohol dehydrogenase